MKERLPFCKSWESDSISRILMPGPVQEIAQHKSMGPELCLSMSSAAQKLHGGIRVFEALKERAS